jgi:hypothetical protein
MLIEKFKKEGRYLYPILLTHLDPAYFHHMCFNRHKLKVRYLARNPAIARSQFLDLVKLREDANVKVELEKSFFHYDTADLDLSAKLQLFPNPFPHQTSHLFYEAAHAELNKYLAEPQQAFDCIAVLFAVRLEVERKAFGLLRTDAERARFLNEHGTSRKLDYCQDIGVEIPEYHFLLGVIYNESLHWREGKDFETPLRSKLGNSTIRNLVQELFRT